MDEGFKGLRGGTRCKVDEKMDYKKMKCVKKSKQETQIKIIIPFIIVIISGLFSIFYKLWYFLIFILIIFVIFIIINYNSIKNSFS